MKERVIHMGEVDIGDSETVLKTGGVGSCVVIMLYDPVSKVGGMAHAMLPCEKGSDVQKRQHPERYVEIAIDALIAKLEMQGVRKGRLEASVIGGAQMFAQYENAKEAIGVQNVRTAKLKLSTLGIRVTQEETGGTSGRNVTFSCSTGTCSVDTKSKS